MTIVAECISCGEAIYFTKSPRLEQKTICPHCSANLEVVEVNPLELDWPYEEEEDWEVSELEWVDN